MSQEKVSNSIEFRKTLSMNISDFLSVLLVEGCRKQGNEMK